MGVIHHPVYRRYLFHLWIRGGMFIAGLVLVGFTLLFFPFPVEALWTLWVVHGILGGIVLFLETRPRAFLREMAEVDPRWADHLATLLDFERHPPPSFYQEAFQEMLATLPPPTFPKISSQWVKVGLLWSLILVGTWDPARWERSLLYNQEDLRILPDTVTFVEDTVVIFKFPGDQIPLQIGERKVYPLKELRRGQLYPYIQIGTYPHSPRTSSYPLFPSPVALYIWIPSTPGRFLIQGRTQRQWIRVLPRPLRDLVTLVVSLPAYTGISKQTLRAGDRAWVMEGSTLKVKIAAPDSVGISITLDTVHRTWTCPCDTVWVVESPIRDSSSMVWVWQGMRSLSMPPIHLYPLRDRPPRVEITPAFVQADQVDTLQIRIVGIDDFGLKQRLLQRHTPWKTTTSRKTLQGMAEYEEDLTEDVAAWGLLPGDTAWIRVRVQDVADQWSAWETLRVVYPDLSHLAEFPDEGDLEPPQETLERFKERWKRIREEVLQKQTVDSSLREVLSQEMERQEEALQALQKQAERIQQSLETLTRFQEMDPRLIRSLQETAQLLQEALGEELQRRMEALRQQLRQQNPSGEALARTLEAIQREQEQVLQRLEALKELLKDLKAFRDREALREDIDRLAAKELEVESRTLGGAPLDSLERSQAEITGEAARIKPNLPPDLQKTMDKALKAMEEAQTAMRNQDRTTALSKTQEARKTLQELSQQLQQRQRQASQRLAQEAQKALEEARWRLLGWATFRADTTPVAGEVLREIAAQVRQTSALLYFSTFRAWQALDQAVVMLEEGRTDPARKVVHLVILSLFETQQKMQQQGQPGAQALEQMVQQLLQGMRQNTQALGGVLPLPMPLPRQGEGTLEALRQQMESLRQQAQALQQALPEGSPAGQRAGDLARTLEENLRKLREGKLSKEDVARQREATEKFLRALRAEHRKGFRQRRRSTPGKPFTPEPPNREALDPFFDVLRQQISREDLPPMLLEMYRKLWQQWTVPSS